MPNSRNGLYYISERLGLPKILDKYSACHRKDLKAVYPNSSIAPSKKGR